jgi:two-component system phosphate regulon sensor histidine kinase PhoR
VIERNFFLLESRRFLVSLATGGVCWFFTHDWMLSLLLAVSVLAASWGWQLVRVYRWFAHPEDLPPIGGAGVRSILHDVYVLRSRQPQNAPVSQRSQPYLKESLASMRDAALIIDGPGNLVWCNDAAEYLLGIRFGEEEGRPLSKILPGKSLKKYLREANFQKPLRVKPGPDPEFCLQFEFSRFGANDRLVFVKDVTEQDKLERMRRDFVGNVSHELRTPLTVIKGYIETLQSLNSEYDTRLQKSLGSMGVQAVRMESLISDLLWLSRIESVEGERKDDQLDLVELLTNLCSELMAAWPDRQIELVTPSELCVLGDAAELRSAISNLIVNALKYSEASVRVIWKDTVVGPALLVEDQGPGIDAKHIPRLTERFYRVDKSRSQSTGGTGLGLAIVKHVAVSHDAKLFVDSEVGRGSAFRLVFPSERAVACAICLTQSGPVEPRQ